MLFNFQRDASLAIINKLEKYNGCILADSVGPGKTFTALASINISDEVVTAIAKKQPYYAVFRDSGMASDSVLTNFDQIFASISPTTVRRVL